MTKTHVSLPDAAEAGLRGFIEDVDDRISAADDPDALAAAVRETLVDLNGDRDAYEAWRNGESVSPVEQARLLSYDPRNTTLESEYYAEKDAEAFARSKPLQWLWRQFDNMPVADNVEFALRFRRMLANHLFAECGDGVRLFKGITFTYGHNIELGENCVVHDDVHLDDRGRLTIGDRVSISDGANIYSHDHDIVDQTAVENFHTIIEDDVRITQGVLVRAGVKIGENSVVGARANVQGDVPAHHIAVGAPAKSVKIKPGWEDVAVPVDADVETPRDERKLEFELPDDLDHFDEFERELTPPGDD